MTQPTREFESEVRKATSIILAASHKAALAILDEAFSQRGTGRVSDSDAKQRSCGTRRPGRSRRSSEDVAALARNLFQEVWTNPGQTISTIGSRMGVLPVELRIPVRLLKREGKLRTAGVGQLTKYFPVSGPERIQPKSS